MRKKFKDELNSVKENIVDSTLYFGAIMGLIVFFLSYGTNLYNGAFQFQMLTDLIALIGVTLVAKFRKKIPFEPKAYFLLFIFYLLISVEILRLGVISENNVLIILIPFVSLIALSRKQFWLIIILTVIAYAVVAYLFISEEIPSEFDFYNKSVTNWISRLAMLTIVAFVVLVIFHQFNKKYLQIIGELTKGNDQLRKNELELNVYKDHLRDLVDKRTEELTMKISELKQMQTQLLHSEKMASLGTLSAGVGHEINNPLNFIVNGFEGIKRNLEYSTSTEMDQYIAAVDEGVKRISRIVKSLTQYSKYDDVSIESCNIKEVTENCLLLLNWQMIQKIKVITSFQSDEQSVRCNSSELHQVIANIIYNSVQSIVGQGDIKIEGHVSKDHYLLNIIDTGCGISKENLPKIWDPFFTTKPTNTATGLGLTICAQIVKKHAGNLQIESEWGKGTKVTLTLPHSNLSS